MKNSFFTRFLLVFLLFYVGIIQFSSGQGCSQIPVQEAVVNGDFEWGYLQGNGTTFSSNSEAVNFYTDLTYAGDFTGNNCFNGIGDQWGIGNGVDGADQPNCCTPGGIYNPYAQCSYLGGAGNWADHTTGTSDGFALIADVNGLTGGTRARNGNIVIWEQTVDIFPAQVYYFSAWMALYGNQPGPQLEIDIIPIIGGNPNNAAATLVPVTGVNLTNQLEWEQFTTQWTNVNNYTQVVLRIQLTNAGSGGSSALDFAVDDISFINSCQNTAADITYSIAFDDTEGNLCESDGDIELTIRDDNGNVVTNAGGVTIEWYSAVDENQSPQDPENGSTGSSTFTVDDVGFYRACVYDPANNGCAVSAVFTATKSMDLDIPDFDLCTPSSVNLNVDNYLTPGGSYPKAYSWNTLPGGVTDPGNSSNLTVATAGIHEVTVSNPNVTNCEATSSFNVTSSLPTAQPQADYCTGSDAILNNGSGTWRWCEDAACNTVIGEGTGNVVWSGAPSTAGNHSVYLQNAQTTTLTPSLGPGALASYPDAAHSSVNITVNQTVELTSVDIRHPNWTGVCASGNPTTMTISLSGDATGSVVANIPCSDASQTVNLGFTLPPGNYTLSVPASELRFNNTLGTTSTSGGEVSISSSNGTVFGNMVFAASQACDPVAVAIEAIVCCTAPSDDPTINSGASTLTICPGEQASVVSNTISGGLDFIWQIDRNDGNGFVDVGSAGVTSGGAETLASITEAGDYRIKIAETGNLSEPCVKTSPAVTVTINPTPDDPTVSNVTVCAGQALNVSASSSVTGGGTITYSWDGPGANDGTGSPFNVTGSADATHAGTYTVTVSANGCEANNTGDVEVTVNDVPADPAFTTSQSPICQGTNGVAFAVGAIAGADSYTWNYTGTGATINGTSESVTIDFSGSATSGNVEVYATNSCGNSGTVTFAVTIDPPASFTTEPVDQAVCEGTDVTFTSEATGPGVTSYQWYGPGGVLAGEQNADLTLTGVSSADAGDYYVEFTASCGTINSATAELTVNPNTTITVHPADDTQCEGSNASFSVTATGTAPLSYAWEFNGGTPVGGDNATLALSGVTAADAGNYGVTVTGGCGAAVSSNLASLTVNTAPSIDTDPVALGLCAGSNASFNVVASGTAPLTYQWQLDGSNVPGGTSDVLDINNIVEADGGVYTVIVTNSCGSVTSAGAELTITLTEFPSVSLTVDEPSVCEGETVTYTAVGNATGAGPTYDFIVDGTAQGPGASNTFTTAPLTANTTVSVVLNSNSTCIDPAATNPATSSDVSVVVVAPPSVPVIDQPNQQICVEEFDLTIQSLVSGAATWSTDVGTVTPATGEATRLAIPSSGNTAVVTVTVSNGAECPEETATVVIERVGDMTTPSAGVDQRVCDGTDVTLSANSALQAGETGTWTLPAGVNLVSGTLTDFDAEVSAGPGTYSLTWTIDNGGICPEADAQVEIVVEEAPGNVVIDQSPITTCASSITLNAQTPTPASAVGTWSISSQPGAAASIANINNPTSTANIENGTTMFLWTVVNGTDCPSESATLVVDKLGDITSPTITLNGGVFSGFDASNQEVDLCAGTEYVLTGAAPNINVNETGLWANDNGGTNASALLGTDVSQTLTLNEAGTQTVLSWTIDNPIPTCAPETRTVTINVFGEPVAELTNVSSNDICEGEVVTLTANATNGTGVEDFAGGLSGAAPNFSLSGFNPGANVFTWTVSNPACPDAVASTTITMTENVTPTLDISSAALTYCNSQNSATINVDELTNQGGGQISWVVNGAPEAGSNSALTLDISNVDVYFIEASITSDIVCVTTASADDTLTINSVSGPDPQIVEEDQTICSTDAAIVLTTAGVGSGDYEWYLNGNLVAQDQTTLTDVSQEGEYVFVEIDAVCGPISSDPFNLMVDDPAYIEPDPKSLTIFVDDAGGIDLNTDATSISWIDAPYFIDDTSSSSPIFSPLSSTDEGEYVLTIVGVKGECETVETATVIVRTPVIIPNTFTPNADQINDVWNIPGISTYSGAIVKVYNRWGSVVHEQYGGYAELWDGSRNGKQLPAATYYYVIDLGVDDINGQFHKGDVTIIR